MREWPGYDVCRYPINCVFSALRAELLHEPIGNIGAAIEPFFSVTDAIEHRTVRRIHGILVQLERAPRMHNAVVVAVADEHGAFALVRLAFQSELFNFLSSFFEILGAYQPAQAILNGWVVIKDIIDQIICAAPHGHRAFIPFSAVTQRGPE